MEAIAEKPKLGFPSVEKLEAVASRLLELPQVVAPVEHIFGPGVYIRKVTIPAGHYGSFAIGKFHRHPHMNVMLRGRVAVLCDDGSVKELAAPQIFQSPPGQKVGCIIEDMVWLNIYATEETDIEKLEAELFDESASLDGAKQNQMAAEASRRHVDRMDFHSAIAELGFTAEQVRAMSEFKPDQDSDYMLSTKLVLSKSPIEGLGVFASGNFKVGEVVGVARFKKESKLYRTKLGRYVNHSKEPNVKSVDVGDGKLELVAIRSILGMRGGLLGDEVVLDYRQAFSEAKKTFT